VFLCTEIAVEKHFDPPKCDYWRGLGGLKKFSRLAIACRFLRPPRKLCCNSTTAPHPSPSLRSLSNR